jgi:mycothiol synthase
VTDGVAWVPMTFESGFDRGPGGAQDGADLIALARRCLDLDGGLPLAADPGFLRRRWAAPGTVTVQARDREGTLVAAGAVRIGGAGDGATFTGMVDPAARERGLGAHLLSWGLAEAGRHVGPVTVETESLTAGAEALFAARELRQVFAEDVMRVDLTAAAPDRDRPEDLSLTGWTEATAGRFHAVYDSAFRERPGFPGSTAEEWIADVAGDDEFRPAWSMLATVPGLGDVGFVTAAVDWIVQVGVVPAARGRGIGGALIAEGLRRMRTDGGTQAWLDVNVDNPAVRLYRKLGFEHRGRRARYRFPSTAT